MRDEIKKQDSINKPKEVSSQTETRKKSKNYPLRIDGFEGQSIEVELAGFLGGAKLLVNGQLASKGPKLNQMILRRNDGKEVLASWKPQIFGIDVPKLSIDGNIINIAEPFKWYEWLLAGFPICLLFIGGALGGGLGAVAVSINTKILRSSLHGVAKFFAALGISLFTVIVFFIIASLFAHAK